MSDGQEDRLGATEGAVKRGPGRPRRAAAMEFDEHILDDRGLDQRDTDADREEMEDERLALFLDTQHQTVLPSLPNQDGYHLCWLSTTNPRDSIHWRISIGYELVRLTDCPDWDGVKSDKADYAGVVSVAEMVAAKIPVSLYNKLMRAVHHRLPMHEEEKLRSQTELVRDRAERHGTRVTEIGSGTADIVQRAKPPGMFQH